MKTDDEKAAEMVEAFKPLADAAKAVREKMRKDDGGPAFPVVCADHSKTQTFEAGMTLRDYFAAKAMAEMVSRGENDGPFAAESSYRYADAMMIERSK